MIDGAVYGKADGRRLLCILRMHPIKSTHHEHSDIVKRAKTLTPPARPNTSLPTFHLVTSLATASTIPENSTPRISDAPGGGGYIPLRCMISDRLSPNALTYLSYKS